MTKLFTIVFLLMTSFSFAQSDEEYWDQWNKNYPKVDIIEILKYERNYADSVEKNQDIPPYYARLDKFRFQAEYLGKTRPTNEDVLISMRNVFKLFAGNPSQLDNMCNTEVLFKIGNEEIWLPIQPNILKAIKKETKNRDMLILYCLFFNEHSTNNKLYNTFLISEFNK